MVFTYNKNKVKFKVHKFQLYEERREIRILVLTKFVRTKTVIQNLWH